MGSGASVAELGEFGLIARLAGTLAWPASPGLAPGLKVGIGDDAAVWAPTPNTWNVITTDALIENVHFRLRTTSWYDLGWKSLAVNLSDVAAMGARPRYAVVSLGVPGDVAVAAVEEFGRGLADVGARYGTALVGGDTVAAPCATISVTVVGETPPAAPGAPPPLLQRSTGRVGDAVAVTGQLGASAGGLRLLEDAARAALRDTPRAAPAGPDLPAAEALRGAHLRPTPRVDAAAVLLAQGVRCAMDLSDGLLGDARRLADASAVGVVLEAPRVPVAPALARLFPDDALALALGGGEDYELLCAGPDAVLAEAAAALAARGEPPLTVVGRLVAPPAAGPRVRVVDARGAPLPISGGYVHFRG
ncbi:MAG TPA: thiamine-phosphate kinase [Chloroflexota bacterium]|nr:thiamine-phosphate kinase [Chloroflexota bacterium]